MVNATPSHGLTATEARSSTREVDDDPRFAALHKLVLLATLVLDRDVDDILAIGFSMLPELSLCTNPVIYLVEGRRWWPTGAPTISPEEIEALKDCMVPAVVGANAGHYVYSIPMRCRSVHVGYLFVEAEGRLDDSELVPLQLWCLQIAAAIENARRHARAMSNADELSSTIGQLRDLLNMQERLAVVATQGGGIEGIAAAVLELTQRPVAVEDASGNRIVSMGNWPPVDTSRGHSEHERLTQSLRRQHRPVRVGDELIGLANYHGDSHALLKLYDPERQSGEFEIHVLEYAATVLAMGLARSAVVAETELRLRRDLVEELLLGLGAAMAQARAEALEIDLKRVRRVAVLRPVASVSATAGDRLLHVVRRALGRLGDDDALLVARGHEIVCLVDAAIDWNATHKRITAELRCGARYRVGIGDVCCAVDDYPVSLRHAQQALTLTCGSPTNDVVQFDDLGVYKLFAAAANTADLNSFIAQWLQQLIDYDEAHSSDLVRTLTSYLRTGGSLRATSDELTIHRSTVKYRLDRVRSLTDYDLNDPTTRFSVQLAAYALETQRRLLISAADSPARH